MAIVVGLLRGVNVGGNRMVPMADLKAGLEAAGFAPVKTHLNSGNVIFEAGALTDEAAAKAVAKVVQEKCGFAPEVVVRSAAELKAALAADPFPEESGSRLLITFLDGPPRPEGVKHLEAWKDGPERLKVIGHDVFVSYADGLADSKLAKLNWGRILAVSGTARNRNTVAKLVELAEGLAK